MEPLVAAAESSSASPPPRAPWYSWRRLGLNFLTLSLLFHLLLGIGAAYYVVSVSRPKKKNFGAPTQGASHQAAEHKVALAKARQRASAPAAVKRVTTTGMSRVALPAMPSQATDAPVVPVTLSGMGGLGLSTIGGPGGGTGGDGGGGGLNVFGSRSPGAGLVGNFYDLKQTSTRQPTGMTPLLYGERVTEFVRGGFDPNLLTPYFKAGKPMYATRIFTPYIKAELGPAEFGVANQVKPLMWVVHYQGTVIAPESGTFRFEGMGDDVLIVRFNRRVVLDACWYIDTKEVPGQTHFPWDWPAPKKGATAGATFTVEAGQSYPMEVLIGEQPGGHSAAVLFIKKEGEHYERDIKGAEILPMFRMNASMELAPPPPGSTEGYARHAPNGPIWRSLALKPEAAGLNH